MFAGLKRAKQFTSQVVTASKSTPRKLESTDIVSLMRDTVEFAGAGSNVHVCVRSDENLRQAVADPVKLSQVLQNLVMNGIQAMPHGGYMDVQALNHLVGDAGDGKLKPGKHVRIIVRDRGYVELLALLRHARCLVSGAEGQLLEEAGALGITSMTVGPETDDDDLAGRCDIAVGLDVQLARRAVRVVNANDNRLDDKAAGPDIWDGGAASRVTKWLAHWLGYKYRAKRKDKEPAQ